MPVIRRLAHYELNQLLGRGGMGEVYLAYDTSLHRQVAIKLLLPDTVSYGNRRQRFLREARMAASLSHPYIVTVFEVGEEEGQPFIAMEYVKGRSLRERLAEGPIPLPEALRIAAQVTRALGAAHQAGIIHRDIKPENVLLPDSGDVKVLDFGLAHFDPLPSTTGTVSDVDATVTALTIAGGVVGTFRYMSPEQIRSQKLDGRSDLFNVGILLFEMLTGRPPFDAPNWAEMASQLLAAPLPKVAAAGIEVPEAVEELVAKCLARDPALRHRDAAELTEALESIELRKPGRLLRIRKLSRRLWIVLAASMALLAAGAIYLRLRQPVFPSVAVLAFANETGRREWDYAVSGLAEGLREDLRHVQGLVVVPSALVARFQGSRLPMDQAARELQTSAVLAGAVRSSAQGSPQVDVTLTAVPSGQVLWSQSYPLDPARTVAVADRLFLDAAYHLGQRQDSRNAKRKRTASPEAYDLFLRGRAALDRRGQEDIREGVRLFTEAIENDREFALAYASLSEAYTVLSNLGSQPPIGLLRQAKENARRAVEFDPSLSDAHLSYALTFVSYDFDWPAAERSFRRALELDPRSARAHVWYAMGYLFPQKRFEEGLVALQRCRDLDPVTPSFAVLQATGLYQARRYDEALSLLTKIDAPPLKPVIAATAAYIHIARNQPEEALRTLDTLGDTQSNRLVQLAAAFVHAAAGHRAEAKRRLADLEAGYQAIYVSPCAIGTVHARLGDLQGAMRWLAECRSQGDQQLRWAGVDPRWDSIRSEPAFKNLLRELGLP